MPSPNNILVLGLGELGHSILTSLASQKPSSTKLTVLLRPTTLLHPSSSKATELAHLRSLDISFLPADVLTLSLRELAVLFNPFDLVISALGFASPEGGLQVKITKAVLEAGVEWYIPWQFGVDYEIVGWGSYQPVWDEQLVVRGLLYDQTEGKTRWIIISTGIFTSFLFEEGFGVVVKESDTVKVRALGGWENRVTVTTPGDIGRLTAGIVFENNHEVANQIIFTAGETISYQKLADIVEAEIGTWKGVQLSVEREVWTTEMLKGLLEGDLGNNVLRYRVVFAEGRGVSWGEEKTWNKLRGIETTDVAGWVEENLRGKFGL